MTLEQAVAQSLRLARILSPDPDAESAAAVAAWKAHDAYDEARGVPFDRWLSLCVRRAVRASQKPHEGADQTKPPGWWISQADSADFDAEWSPDWELLVEHHIDRVPVAELAKLRNVTTYSMNKRLAAAVSRLF